MIHRALSLPGAGAGAMAGVAVALLGCVSQLPSDPAVAVRPIAADHPTFRAPHLSAEGDLAPEPAIAPMPPPAAELHLEQALERALARNPELSALAYEVRIRQGEALQAGLRPNPELAAELENVLGTGTVSGLGASETTLLLSQRLETAGKRPRRRRVAELGAGVAAWELETARLALVRRVSTAFYRVLAAQERVAVTREILGIARQAADGVGRLVRAGATPPVDRTRAELEVTTFEVELATALRDLEAARIDLAATWGADRPDFERVAGDLAATRELPDLGGLRRLLALHPELARWDAEIERQAARVELEDARRIPDVTVGAGVRRLAESDDTGLVAGLSLPLPVFDRNQGRRAAARAALRRARHERRAAEVRLAAALDRAWQRLAARSEEVRQLRESILPAARAAYDGVRRGFEQGLFRNVDVLDAGRRLAELRLREIGALEAWHEAVAEIEGLTGHPIAPGEGTP